MELTDLNLELKTQELSIYRTCTSDLSAEFIKGLNPTGPYLSLEKKKISCAVFINSIKREREIRKFQVGDLQRRLRNKKKCNARAAKLLFCKYKPIAFYQSR